MVAACAGGGDVERALCLCCRTRPHPCRRVLACVHACYLAAGLALQRSHNGDWGGDRSDEPKQPDVV
jgi:hypothetical protein